MDIQEAEREFEEALIGVHGARDAEDRYIILLSMSLRGFNDAMSKTRELPIRSADIIDRINELMSMLAQGSSAYLHVKGEETLAHHIGLLAKAWEACARYERIRKGR